MSSAQRRVAVVGGGVVGCATAYQLARAGFAATLLERHAIAAHASGRNAGNLNPLQGTQLELRAFALEAFHLHGRIRRELLELGCQRCDATPVDRIHLGYEPADRTRLAAIAELFGATPGFSSRWLEGPDLMRSEPRLARDTACGVLTRGNLTIDGGAFSRSLAAGAARLGAEIVHAEVVGVTTRDERVSAVQTAAGALACDELVLATGPWTSQSHSWLGVEIPVEPVKGEIVVVRSEQPPTCDLTWDGTSIYRRDTHAVWIGTTTARTGCDETPTAEARVELLARAGRIMPEVAGAPVVGQLAALRPVSSTGAPIAARAGGWQNVYIANGAGSKGLLLSVGIGKAIVDLLVAGRSAPATAG